MGSFDRFREKSPKYVEEQLRFAREMDKEGHTAPACIGFEKVFHLPGATPRQKEQALRYLFLSRGASWMSIDELRAMTEQVTALHSETFFTQIDQELV